VTRKLIFDKGAHRVLEIYTRGDGRLAKMLSAMYVGDSASVYLGILNGLDPTPIPIIEELKRQLETRVNMTSELKKKIEITGWHHLGHVETQDQRDLLFCDRPEAQNSGGLIVMSRTVEAGLKHSHRRGQGQLSPQLEIWLLPMSGCWVGHVCLRSSQSRET